MAAMDLSELEKICLKNINKTIQTMLSGRLLFPLIQNPNPLQPFSEIRTSDSIKINKKELRLR